MALEVNGLPDRLDLSGEHVAEALAAGVTIVCSTDAHSTRGLQNMELSLLTARRGGAATTEQPSDTGGGGGGGGVAVSMQNIQFDPKDITVKPGETITFTNDESIPHDVHKQSGPGGDCALVVACGAGPPHAARTTNHAI